MDAAKTSMLSRGVNAKLIALFVFLFLSLAVLTIGFDVSRFHQSHIRQVAYAENRLLDMISRTESIMFSYEAFHRSQHTVDKDSFGRYAKILHELFPDISYTFLLERVTDEKRRYFIEQQRQRGYPSFRITEVDSEDKTTLKKADERGVYYSVTNISPLRVRLVRLLGYDMYSSAEMRVLLDKAITSGKTQASPPLNVLGTGHGILLALPVYDVDSVPSDSFNRHRYARRLVAVYVLVDNIIRYMDVQNAKLILTYKQPSGGQGSIVKGETNDSVLPGFTQSIATSIAGQDLNISIQKQLQWRDFNYRYLAGALILSLVVSLLMREWSQHRQNRSREYDARQKSLENGKARAEDTLDAIIDGIISVNNDLNITHINKRACAITEWDEHEAIGRHIDEVVRLIDTEQHETVKASLYPALERECEVHSEGISYLINRSGRNIAVENAAAPIRDDSGHIKGTVLTIRNVTSAYSLIERLEHEVDNDPVTGLGNRRSIDRKITQVLLSNRYKKQSSIAYLHIEINPVEDTQDSLWTYEANEALLKEIASQIKGCIGSSHLVAYLGGDEFALLMQRCTVSEAEIITRAVLENIKRYAFTWNSKVYKMTAYAGLLALDNANIETPVDVIRFSHRACMIAGKYGAFQLHNYKSGDAEITRDEQTRQWQIRLIKSLDNNSFCLMRQTMESLAGSSNQHCEIFVRMLDDNHEYIEPQAFIPLAETNRIMPDIDRWVIVNAFRMIKVSQPSEISNTIYHINLSNQSVSDAKLVKYIKDNMTHFRIPANAICFEIMESSILSSLPLTLDFVMQLKKLGCRIALDDFGYNFMDFNALQTLQLDYIKFRNRFIKNISFDYVSESIVRMVNDISHNMGIETIASCVENSQDNAKLRSLGVDHLQGLYIERPVEWEVQEHKKLA